LKKTLERWERCSEPVPEWEETHQALRVYVHAQGKIDLKNGSIDESYKGRQREWPVVRETCGGTEGPGHPTTGDAHGGDKIETDINPSRRLGIKAVQYIGYIDQGRQKRITEFPAFSN